MKNKLILFSTAFLQVFFVSISTYFIAKKFYYGVAVAGFMISFIWTFNIKKVAFGKMPDRIAYALGAMVGSVIGLLVSSHIY